MELLGQAGLQRLFTNHMASRLGDSNTDDDGLEGGYGGLGIGSRRRRRPRNGKAQYPLVPSDDGKTLMAAGIFGNNEYYEHTLKKRKPRLAGRLMSRELGLEGANPTQINRLLTQVRALIFGNFLSCISPLTIG